MHGTRVNVPLALPQRPDRELLQWHNDNVFRG
jgi:hypothetical protein